MRAALSRQVERVLSVSTFLGAALRYWLIVFPQVRRELRDWRGRASQIPDPGLRRIALDALAKRSNMEGAAAFATFVPRRRRRDTVRALVAFQALYNHADMLAEQPSADPVGEARRGHQVLGLALGSGGDQGDPEDPAWSQGVGPEPADATAGVSDDGGYLAEMTAACNGAVMRLPSWGMVALPARRLAARIIDFQSLSLGPREQLEHWARGLPTSGGRFEWWELTAAAGSSLGVNALIAAAASPMLAERDVVAIEAGYFPTIGALHSLLDSLVDEAEDAATGQLRLLDCYSSREQAATGLQHLTLASLDAARALPRGRRHVLLVTAMACSYLAAPEASAASVAAVARSVRDSLGPLAGPMLLILRLRGLAGETTEPTASAAGQSPQAAARGPETRSADARAA